MIQLHWTVLLKCYRTAMDNMAQMYTYVCTWMYLQIYFKYILHMFIAGHSSGIRLWRQRV